MIATTPTRYGDVRAGHDGGRIGRISRGLRLAATPMFAAMALVTAVGGAGGPDLLCSATGRSPLGGMPLMYLLMSATHLPAWLEMFARRHFVRTP